MKNTNTQIERLQNRRDELQAADRWEEANDLTFKIGELQNAEGETQLAELRISVQQTLRMG